jgi:hypothetical protein
VDEVPELDEARLPLWSDNPADSDLLGFVDVARPIASAIRRERLNPVSIGLVGPWGSGKTTVLRLVEAELVGDKRVIVVNTSPWAYDPKLDVKTTLIGDVLQGIRDAAPQRGATETVLAKLRDLADKVRWSKAFALAAKTAITVQVPKWDDIEGLFKMGEGDDAGSEKDPSLSGFKEDFKNALAHFDTVDRVVVLVDDLDRCLPESVISTLEAIKLFLSVDKMAFVIAYDRDPVVQAIAIRYEKARNPEEMARHYLEKIVQVPVNVPRLGEDDVRTFLAITLLAPPLLDESDLKRIVANAQERRAAGERPLLDEHGVSLSGQEADRMAMAQRLAPVIAMPFEGNPRRIKRFLNDFWIRLATAKARNVGLEQDALAKLMVLEQVHGDQFKELVTWAAQDTVAEKLTAIEEERLAGLEHWALPDLRAWASLAPKLSTLNLRPYLELAASLRSIPFSAIGLPPELRAIMDSLIDGELAIRKAGQAKAKALDPESRVVLAQALIQAIPMTNRQGDYAEAIPELVNGDDAVGRAVVTEIKKLNPGSIEPGLAVRVSNCGVPSTDAFIDEMRRDPAYKRAVTGLPSTEASD